MLYFVKYLRNLVLLGLLLGSNTSFWAQTTVSKLDVRFNSPFDETSPFLAHNDHFLGFSRQNKLILAQKDLETWVFLDFQEKKPFEQKLLHISPDAGYIIYSEVHSDSLFLYKARIMNRRLSLPQRLALSFPVSQNVSGICFNTEENQVLFSAISKNGQQDLFSTFLKSDQTWSQALPMNSKINSNFNEITPFLHPNQQILYFSSNRPNGMGGFDLYKSTLEQGQWSDPVLLPSPINTSADEIYWTTLPNSQMAYFTSNRPGGEGGFDIYEARLPKDNIPLTLIKGRVLSEEGDIPPKTQIRVYDVEANQELKYVYNPNPENGDYLLIFPPNKNYNMVIEAEGYKSHTINIHVPEQSYYYQLQQTIFLRKDKASKNAIEVNNLFDDNIQRRDQELSREENLLNMIEKIISTVDTQALRNLDEYIAASSSNETRYYTSLVFLIEKVIEKGDLEMLDHLENMTKDPDPVKPDLQLYFSSNSAILTPESTDRLRHFLNTLSPNSKLEISGHSDNLGTTLSKYVIASLRVQSVTQFMETVNPLLLKSVVAKVKSDREPIISSNAEEGLEKSRRVEIRILK